MRIRLIFIALALCVAVPACLDTARAERVSLEGVVDVSLIYHDGTNTGLSDKHGRTLEKVFQVCSMGDTCRIDGIVGMAERLGPVFLRIDKVRRMAATERVPFDITGVRRSYPTGYCFLTSTGYQTPRAVMMQRSEPARRIAAVCADGDVCRIRGLGTRDPQDASLFMPSELHEVELVQRARLVTVEMTGVYSGGSAGNFDVVGDEEDQFLDGLEQFADTPVGRTMRFCKRYRVVALVRDTDPHRLVDLLAVGCAQPYPDEIPAAVEGGPQ